MNELQTAKQSVTRLQRLGVGLLIALLAAVAFGMTVGYQGRQAKMQAEDAIARQLAAQAQLIHATEDSKQITAVLLAIQSMRMHPSIDAEQILQTNPMSRPIARVNHDGGVTSVAFSPDGKYVVSGSTDGAARVWDTASSIEIARMNHDDSVTSVAFSPDGKYVISGSVDHTARVWDAATGQEIARITHDGTVNTVIFSSDGRYVASGSEGGNLALQVWEAATGKTVAAMDGAYSVISVAFSSDTKYVIAGGSMGNLLRVWEVVTGKEVTRMTNYFTGRSVAFSPDDKYIVSGGCDETINDRCTSGTARVWEAGTGTEIARITYDAQINTVAFSPDGQYVISGGCDEITMSYEGYVCIEGTARVWEANTGREISRMTHAGDVTSVAFSPDGKYAISGSEDKTARVWEAATGREMARATHDDKINAVAFSPDGTLAVSGGDDRQAQVWKATRDTEISRMIHDSVEGVLSVAFSADGKYVISIGGCDEQVHISGDGTNANVCKSGTVRVWDAANGREVTRMTHESGVYVMALSPDGKYMASGSWGMTARVWEIATGREVARMAPVGGFVESVAFSPDGRYLATGGLGLYIWEAATGREVARMAQSIDGSSLVTSEAFSPDGKYIVSGISGEDSAARVWDAATGEEIAHMNHSISVDFVAFSPDGKYVISGSDGKDDAARIWEATTGREVTRITFADADRFFGTNSVAFSPDGKYVVLDGDTYTARIWEVDSGKEIARMTHAGGVTSVAFSPDGKYVVSGSSDKTARVWEADTGKEVARMTHDGTVFSVAFSTDGKYVVSGSTDKTVRVWMWRPEDWITDACTRVPRNLSRAEWEQYVGDVLPYQAVCPNLPMEPDITPTPVSTATSPAFNSQSNRIFSSAGSRNVIEIAHYEKAAISNIAYYAEGNLIVITSPTDIYVYDSSILQPEPMIYNIRTRIVVQAYSPNGKMIAYRSNSNDRIVELWNVHGYQMEQSLTFIGPSASTITRMTFSPDNRLLALGTSDGQISIWDVARGKLLLNMGSDFNARPVSSLAFSPDGKILAACKAGSGVDGLDSMVELWDAAHGEFLRNLNGCQGSLSNLLFSPDGSTLAIGPDEQSVTFWNVGNGKLLHTLDLQIGPMINVAFSPDGKTLVPGADGTIEPWDVGVQPSNVLLQEHGAQVWSIFFSPDGKGLASQSNDDVVKQGELDVADRHLFQTINNRTEQVNSAVFSPDGRLIVTASEDGTIRLWMVRP